MVRVEFDDDPSVDEIKRAIGRIQNTGNIPRGIAGGRGLEFDEESNTLYLHFSNLIKSLYEHRVFEEANGFSSTEIDILRVIEASPDRINFAQIRDGVNGDRSASGETSDKTLADSTLQHYLRNLRKKGLIEHDHNQYTYIGP